MRQDACGFLYPEVDESICINCSKCLRVCPVNVNPPEADVVGIYACKNKRNSIRRKSSSGGTFYQLAMNVLNAGGSVYGASFDSDLNLRHERVTDRKDLFRLMGSKYLQSAIGNAYILASKDLKQGIPVLFSGTPCQIAGLRNYLGKDYDNLLSVSVVCHGVPSPGVFHRYVSYVARESGREITSVDFRDKRKGWDPYLITLYHDGQRVMSGPASQNPFMRGFIKNLFIRESCTCCRYKLLTSRADIILGDFWGVNAILGDYYNDNRGVSLVMINSSRGNEAFMSIAPHLKGITTVRPEDAVKYNPSITSNSDMHPQSEYFYRNLDSHSFPALINHCLGEPPILHSPSVLDSLKTTFYRYYGRIRRK